MKKLIAIVGMSGSGKSVASDYLEEIGFNKIYFGKVVLDKLKEENIKITPENEKIKREELREKYGMGAMAEILLPKIKESYKEKDTVLDGLYSWDEYIILKKEFKENLKVIGIITDKNIRYKRVSERKIRSFNKEEIKIRDISEIENLAKGGPIAFADYYILNNKGLKEYKERLEEILKDIENNKGEK